LSRLEYFYRSASKADKIFLMTMLFSSTVRSMRRLSS
jgi:hypothetical protein